MKKLLRILIASALMIAVIPGTYVYAEGEDYSNTDYWNNLCTQSDSSLSSEQKASCTAYMTYMSQQSSSLQEQLADIESQRAAIAANVKEYAAKVQDYSNQASALNDDIADLNGQISVKEAEITAKQEEIDATQEQIDTIQTKLKTRIESQQSTMRLNQYLDIMMGAKSFSDLIRIMNGLSDITNYDQNTWDQLSVLIEQQNKDKEELETAKAELDTAKQSVVDKQNELLALKYQAQIVEEEYRKQQAELEAEGNRIAANIDAIREQITSISNALNEVATSAGWTYPVPGASISANTWYYSSGGIHLGEDFAASQGTSVLAVGNGVVINSADGCPYGYLGSSCGNSNGGSWGGGNQVYLLTSINGSLYAVKYLHLLAGSPAATGTIVSAGTVIGQVGSSGNSSGPHCHIEVFYLGTGSLTSYATSWNGDLAFGCGWAAAALSKLCENGASAPCRVKPESVFGG